MLRTPAVATRLVRVTACFAGALLAAGCATSPVSGRTQFNILPGALETAVPSLRFEVNTLLTSGGEFCGAGEDTCPAREAADRLARRIAPMAERLGAKAAELSPELISRVPQVEVFVVPGDSPAVSSSAGGRIAVGAGLDRLGLSEADLAFALAREFGRLAAAHHRESASAGLAVSLIAGSPLTSAYLATTLLADIVFPMGTLAKIGISLLASMGTEQLVESVQQEEADGFAARVMLAAGYDPKDLAEPRPLAEQDAAPLGWLASYLASRARVAAGAQPDPWPDEALTLLAAVEPWPDETLPPLALAAEPWPDEARQAGAPLPVMALAAGRAAATPAGEAIAPARAASPGSGVSKKAEAKKGAIKKAGQNARTKKIIAAGKKKIRRRPPSLSG